MAQLGQCLLLGDPSLDPQHPRPRKYPGAVALPATPALGGRDRRIPGVSRLASLASWCTRGPARDPVSNSKGRVIYEDTNFGLWFPYAFTHTHPHLHTPYIIYTYHTSCTCMHTPYIMYTHTHYTTCIYIHTPYIM